MGAQQSSTNGAGGGAAGAVEVKTSYYELLGVERTATEEEIKKAYRRKALELHPDRNYGDVERTTALFADVSTAYEVLSDPQERAWYDAHEGDILRGGEKGGDDHYEYNMKVTTAEDISRMMGKFRSNVDFSDSPTGFYGFVRETFDQLAREEERAGDYEGVRGPDYPSFGHKADSYEDVVRNFYAVWNGFATVKSFASMDVYRTSDAPDRRVRRLMEKENKKLREEGIREFNAAVQNLVAFVRKRDPRYTPNTQTAEDKAKAQREARQQQAARARAANAAKIREDEADAVPDWAKARDPDELEEESEEEIEEEHYECVACRKTFKSERQWEAHEKSKKHQKAIYALKKKMQKDNAALNLDDDVPSGVVTPASADDDHHHAVDEPLEDPAGSDTESSTTTPADCLGDKLENVKLEDARTDDNKLNAHPDSKNPKTTTQSATDSDSEVEDDDEYASRSDIEARLAGYRNTPDPSAPLESLAADVPDTDKEPPTAKKLGAAAKKRAKRAAKQAEADTDTPDLAHKCVTCRAGFPSKTKLFEHIKESKHAAPVAATKGAAGGKKGKKR
ncbi:hypothetical protein N0V90_002839 [Kalmusia sp. IMI 367209]|nr:hypothetical protein N0V90_002839 [Kalmusia sp. IMI 367209]